MTGPGTRNGEPTATGRSNAHRRVMRSRPGYDRTSNDRSLAVLADLVRSLRLAAGLGTRRLAQRATVARSTIQRLEAGTLRPRPSLLAAVAAAVDPDHGGELAALLTAAAGGAAALAEDGRWARRRQRARERGQLAGIVPIDSDTRRRIELHNTARRLRYQAIAIGGTRSGVIAVTPEVEALLAAAREASEAAGPPVRLAGRTVAS